MLSLYRVQMSMLSQTAGLFFAVVVAAAAAEAAPSLFMPLHDDAVK